VFAFFWVLFVFLMDAQGVSGTSETPSMTHRMMMLAIQIGFLLFAAKIGNILFEKIKMPGVLGELVVGMVIGPFALGRIPIYGMEKGLFPMYDSQAISPELFGLSSIAAIVLLFTAGLETDLRLLIRYFGVGVLVAIGGVTFSFVFGAGVVIFFAERLLGHGVSIHDPIVLFAGIVSTATSVGITARILTEKHKIDTPEGVTILSAAVIDDVIGIILLAIVIGVVNASQSGEAFRWSHVGLITFKAVGIWLAATLIGLASARKIGTMLKWFESRTSIAIMSLGLGLMLAGLFEEFGLAMIIGAYVMGLTLSQTDVKHVILEKTEGIYEFLVPIFFCTTGMQINPESMVSPTILLFAGVFSFFALLAKVIGCGLPAWATDFNLRGSARVGFGMAPRGEVGLIIAGLGLSSQFLSRDVFGAFVIMVVINTLTTPPVLVFLFRSPESGLKKSTKTMKKKATRMIFDFPTSETAELFTDKLLTFFESQGFYVHTLENRTHEVRKDAVVIDFASHGMTLEVDVRPEDIPLLQSAMQESRSALEKAIHALKCADTSSQMSALDSQPEEESRRSR
jgi:Kef-type K+ transport system membrane component KefB